MEKFFDEDYPMDDVSEGAVSPPEDLNNQDCKAGEESVPQPRRSSGLDSVTSLTPSEQKSADSIQKDPAIDHLRGSETTSRAMTPDLNYYPNSTSRSRQNTNASLPALRKASHDYLLASRYSAGSLPRAAHTASQNYYLNPSYNSGDNVADEVERSFGRRDHTLSPSSQSGGGIVMLKTDTLPSTSIAMTTSKDDYFLGEDGNENKESRSAANDNNSDKDSDDDEEAAALFYEQLKKNTNNNNTATSKLKPTSNSLQMGKKHITHNITSNISVDLTANDKARKRKEIIGQAAADRLHHTATIMKQKKDMLQRKQAREQTLKLTENKFTLNKQSQKLAEGLTSRTGDIADRLYNEAKDKATAIIDDQSKEEKHIQDWSCAQCGTFHTIRSNVDPKSKWGCNISYTYTCSNCQFDQQTSLSFHPTNIGLKYNSEVEKSVLQSRQLEVENQKNKSIHEYLYQTGKQRESILKFNKDLWDEIQASMPFAPTIPASSRDMIKQYLTAGEEDERSERSERSELTTSSTAQTSTTSAAVIGNKFHARLTGHKIKEYFAKPTIERLVSTQTRSTIDEAIKQSSQYQNNYLSQSQQQQSQQQLSSFSASLVSQSNDFEGIQNIEKTKENAEKSKSKSKENVREKKKKFIDRLTYDEPRDKLEKQRVLESKYAYSFTPTIAPIADGVLCGQRLPTENKSKTVIWEVLSRKSAESNTKRLQTQKKEMDKMWRELQQNQVKALPESNEILHEAMQRHLEELFCLLLSACASSLSADSVGANVDENGAPVLDDEDGGQQDPPQPPQPPQQPPQAPNKSKSKSKNDTIIERSKQLKTNFQSQFLDLLLVDPELMINEVSTLLLDMKKVKFRQWQKTRVLPVNTSNNEGLSSVPEALFVTFDEFKDLACKCIRRRNGPGKGYIYAPKKQPDVALQMQTIARQQETFHPTIDITSQEITKARQEAYKHRPIEEILISEGEKLRLKMDIERQKQSVKEEHKYSFKPKLFKAAASVVPRYRGMSSHNENDDHNDDDEYVVTRPLHTAANTNTASAALNHSLSFEASRSMSPTQQQRQSRGEIESKSSPVAASASLTPPGTTNAADHAMVVNSMDVALHTPHHLRIRSIDSSSSSAFKPTALSLDDEEEEEEEGDDCFDHFDNENRDLNKQSSMMSLSLDLDDKSDPQPRSLQNKDKSQSLILSSSSSALPVRKMKFNRSHVPNGQQPIASSNHHHRSGTGSRESSSSPTMMTMDSSVVSDITNEHQSAALRSQPSLSLAQQQQDAQQMLTQNARSLPRSASSESGKMQRHQQQQSMRQSLQSSNQRRLSNVSASSGAISSSHQNSNGNSYKKGLPPPPLPAELLRDQYVDKKKSDNGKKSSTSHTHHHHKKSSVPPPPPPFLLHDYHQGKLTTCF